MQKAAKSTGVSVAVLLMAFLRRAHVVPERRIHIMSRFLALIAISQYAFADPNYGYKRIDFQRSIYIYCVNYRCFVNQSAEFLRRADVVPSNRIRMSRFSICKI